MKKEFPQNSLVKTLSSSLWGLCRNQLFFWFSENEYDKHCCDENTISVDFVYKNIDEQYFICIDKNKGFYESNYRLKFFLTSYCRNKIANIILDNDLIENVIRIHTDGIVLDREFNFDPNLELIPEEKTTGKIKIKNVNSLEKL